MRFGFNKLSTFASGSALLFSNISKGKTSVHLNKKIFNLPQKPIIAPTKYIVNDIFTLYLYRERYIKNVKTKFIWNRNFMI